MRTLFLALLFCLLMPASGFAAEELEEARHSLQQIRQRIDQTLANLESARESEATLVDELSALTRRVNSSKNRLKRLKASLKQLAREILTAQEAVRQSDKRVRKSLRDVERRLVALYKEGEVGPLRVLFSRSTPTEMAWQYEYLTRVVAHDRQLLANYRREKLAQQESLKKLEGLKARKQEALRQQQGHQKLLADARKLKTKLIARVQRDQTLLNTLLERLEGQAGRLQGLVKKLESEKTAEYTPTNGEISAQKGLLPWPAPGKVLVGFGRQKHPQLGTLFQSRGIEIGLTPKTPIKAVWHGKVVFADQFQGYGNLIIIDHGNGFHSLYARLSRLDKRPGELVEQGEQLASADPGHNRLYFEIRQQGAPTNPRSWLGARP